MIGRLLIGPFRLVEPWLRHPSRAVRRAGQVGVLAIAGTWLAFARSGWRDVGQKDEFVARLASSDALREFLHGPGLRRRSLSGRVFRTLLLRLSTAVSAAHSEGGDVCIRLSRPIDQTVLRNLLVWQNHVLPALRGGDDGRQVDLTLLLANGSRDEAQLFDLVSVALMLERIAGFALCWDEAGGRAVAGASDLAELPRDLVDAVDTNGSPGGIKLPASGRKTANDFVKLVLPGRCIIAVALREREDGTVEPGELETWLDLIDRQVARFPDLGFVLLNRIARLQWRDWPAYLRVPRHQGLTLQDAICLAQIADGYVGVLDIFGLAAHSADRPGVYLSLPSDGGRRAAELSGRRQIMISGHDRASVEAALEAFLAARAFQPWS
jgi:hypothetical protein